MLLPLSPNSNQETVALANYLNRQFKRFPEMNNNLSPYDFGIIKQQLGKISSPLFRMFKEFAETLLAPPHLITTLQDHHAKHPLPQGNLQINQLEMPAFIKEYFAKNFKKINGRECNEVPSLMKEKQKLYIIKIQSELTKDGSNMEIAVTECLSHISYSTNWIQQFNTSF